jgi:serine/threonine protein kinase
VDFDAACLAGEQRYDDQGTWGYSPPEQDQGHPVPRSDVSALGITLWELLCGRCPDPVQRHFPALPRGCPAGLKALLRRMLRLEATCRPSAHEVLRSLQAIRQSLSAGSASLSQPTRVPRHLPACWSGRPEQLAHLVVLRSRGPPAAQRQRWLARLHHYSSPPILVRLVRVRAPV